MKKIAVFIPAYKAVLTLISAIERIPQEIKEMVEEIYIFDDCSDDNTYYAGIGYKHEKNIEKLNIYRNKNNLGYGGNQKKGYEYAIKKGYDIVVMLHGDVQYAPEFIPHLIEPLLKDEADAVLGSRFLYSKSPLRQKMPLWKFIGNRVLTFIENKILKANLSEYHTGFRAYNCNTLRELPLDNFQDGYVFDTEILIELIKRKKRIKEIPIPTHYGEESHVISFRKSVVYGVNIMKALTRKSLNFSTTIRTSCLLSKPKNP